MEKDDEGYHFMIVDINRMNFGIVSIKKGLYNLRKFWGPKEFMKTLASEYALIRNANPEEAVDYVMKERKNSGSAIRRNMKYHSCLNCNQARMVFSY